MKYVVILICLAISMVFGQPNCESHALIPLLLLQNETSNAEQHNILIRWNTDLAGGKDQSMNLKPENKIQINSTQTNNIITWTCLLDNLQQEKKYFYSIVEDGKPLDTKKFPRTIKPIKTNGLKLILISNTGDGTASKDYLDSVSAFIRFSPDDFDAVVDLGGQYINKKYLSNSSQSIQYEDGLTKYLPLSISLNENNELLNQFFNYQVSQNSFLNSSLVQIKYLSGDVSSASQAQTKELVFEEPKSSNPKIRIVFANSPFYCSKQSEQCQSNADHLRYQYEKQFSDQNVQLILSGQGDGEYERTLPVFEGISENIDSINNFEESLSMPVYITSNGAQGSHSTMTTKKAWTAAHSSEPSFGVLEIKSEFEIKYIQYSDNHEIIDHFILNIIVENEGDNTVITYVVYGILITCILGFGFFIYNWIKCFLSRPSKEESDSSDSEEETVSHRQRKRIPKEEIELALP